MLKTRSCIRDLRRVSPCEFVSNPTAPTSQRERKFWDRQMGVKRRNEIHDLARSCLSLRFLSQMSELYQKTCARAGSDVGAVELLDDPQAEAAPHLDPMLNT